MKDLTEFTRETKPPIGYMPEFRWIELRIIELSEAMVRFMDGGEIEPIVACSEEIRTLAYRLQELRRK